MPRQGRIQSGTGAYHVMMRGINHQYPVKAGMMSTALSNRGNRKFE